MKIHQLDGKSAHEAEDLPQKKLLDAFLDPDGMF